MTFQSILCITFFKMIQMEASTLQKYLQNLEDYVFIEEKIVTCVWLCQVLKIHVNTAKQLLHAFIEHNAGKNKVLALYLIGGELKDGSGRQLKLVEESDRDATKTLFSRLTADHVYSIQKSASHMNSADVFNAYPHFLVNTEERRFCSVVPSKEVEKRQIKVPVVETKKEISQQPSKVKKIQEKNEEKDKPKSVVDEPPAKQKKHSPEKNNKQAPKAKSGGIAGMFSRQVEKKKNESPKEEKKNDNKLEKKNDSGISGFLHKQPPKKEKSFSEPMETDSDLPIKENNIKIEEKQKEVQGNGEDTSKKAENESQNSSMKDKKLKGKENRKKRKKRDEEKVDDSRKKRKRIVSILSSDSETSGNEESECELEPECTPTEPPPTVEDEEDIIPPTPGRKRVRKQIDKTYTDEDGFILTKKEYVYESCTDDEENEVKNEKEKDKPQEKSSPALKNEEKSSNDNKSTNEKKATKGPSKKQISPANNKNNKQATIMNFFKRK